MKKTAIFLLIFSATLSYSQASSEKKDARTEDWALPAPTEKISAPYAKLSFVDLRQDKDDMGFVQKGAFNRQTQVVPSIPLESQIQEAFRNMVQPTDSQGEIIFQLRDINFSELTQSYSETGIFVFRGSIFSHTNAGYQLLKDFNENMSVSSLDVTKKLENEAGQKVLEILKAALTTKPESDRILTAEEMNSYEKIAKQNIPLFTATSFINGVYRNFESFKNQKPDYQVSEMKKTGSGQKFFYLKPEDNSKTNARNSYAVVYNGQAYINDKQEFKELQQRDNDFYFAGLKAQKASFGKKLGVGVATGVATAILTGGMGVSVVPSVSYIPYEFKIDYHDGTFVPVRSLEPQKNK